MKMLIALSALAAATASTQPAPVKQPDITREQARRRADQLFQRFDVNHDGYVTRAEAQAVGGRLQLLRAATGRDQAPGIGGHTLRYLEQRFTGVQQVTKSQFEAAFLAHFDQMDTNHDGILTAIERQKAH